MQARDGGKPVGNRPRLIVKAVTGVILLNTLKKERSVEKKNGERLCRMPARGVRSAHHCGGGCIQETKVD